MILLFQSAFEIEKYLSGCFKGIRYSLHHSLSHWLVNFSWSGISPFWRLISKYSLYICFGLEIRIDLGKRPFRDVRTSIKKTEQGWSYFNCILWFTSPKYSVFIWSTILFSIKFTSIKLFKTSWNKLCD